MLKLNNLAFSYGDSPLIEDISLSVTKGSYVGIIGPNGSGKSTLLRLIAGILQPAAGSIGLDAQNIHKLKAKIRAQKIAFVPQNVDIPFGFTVEEIVAMGRFPHEENLIRRDAKTTRWTNEVLKKTGLLEFRNRNFNALSGGEKQRVIIASALVQQSHLLLLDEPTSALDLKHQQEIYMLLKQQSAQAGKTVIVVTHDINLAAQYCDRIILMNNGAIVRDGKPEEVILFPVIEETYGVKVYIDINPLTQTLYIMPYDVKTPDN